jgi:prephenate dehydrogenase
VATLGIAGTGLIGASIGLRARAAGMRVFGFDPSFEHARAAAEAGAIDEAVSRDELYRHADLVAIAAPVGATIDEVRALVAQPPRAELIFDVASVKGPIAVAAAGLAHFVASHPMAGSERSGPAAARADLFEDRTWLYDRSADAQLADRLRAFVALLGARPVAIDLTEHDRMVALTSHLPQLIAFAFADTVRNLGEPADAYFGPTARELLRLGASSRELWREIFDANASEISAALRSLDLDDALARAGGASDRRTVS